MAENPNLLERYFRICAPGARREFRGIFGIKGRKSGKKVARALDFLHQEAYIIRRGRRKRKNKWHIY